MLTLSCSLCLFLLWPYDLPFFRTWLICSRPSLLLNITGVPSYVLDYAPVVWLDTGEQYFPSDISAQIENTLPYINYATIEHAPDVLTVENLDSLNSFGNSGLNVYLTSTIDVTTSPIWLDGVVPDAYGKTRGAIPCAVIVNDHGHGHLDAYYTYFYAFNQGNTVFGNELGDHIGDWEHNMVRFVNGTPTYVWYSQHSNGQAFAYSAVEKIGKRPITYAAFGSHANYAIAGIHDHTIPDFNGPWGPLQDYTSRGTLWDPILSAYFYNYSAKNISFTSIHDSPLGAMNFRGKWGDKRYPNDDPRQKVFFGFPKFVSGPTGPWNKQLNRTDVCPDNGLRCILRDNLGP